MQSYGREKEALRTMQTMNRYHKQEWLKTGMECVLKQIPQPVIYETSKEDGIVIDYALICPTCKCDVYEGWSYCQECGQKLDWEELQ